MLWQRFVSVAVVTLMVFGCLRQSHSPSTAKVASIHPLSGLDVIPLTIAQSGRSYDLRVEVARTRGQQAVGLMFRTGMAPDEGMLFPSQTASSRSFWMKNTVIPLDLLFIGPDHRVTNIAADATPYSTEPIYSAGPAIAVLEINAGRTRQLGFSPGARVTW